MTKPKAGARHAVNIGEPAAKVRVMIRGESSNQFHTDMPSIVVHGFTTKEIHEIILQALQDAAEARKKGP